MDNPLDLARRFLDCSVGLREALDVSGSAPLAPLGAMNGEHNANYPFLHPETGRKYLLRINYSSQLGLARQSTYEYDALVALASSGRTPSPIYLDDSRSIIDKGVLAEEFVDGSWVDLARWEEVREVARALADVHAAPASEGQPFMRPGDPLASQYQRCMAFLAAYEQSPYVDDMVLRYVHHFAALTEAALEVPCDPRDCTHVQNTEAVPSHFLIPHASEEDPQRMTGPAHVVDWEKPLIGEVAQDLAYFLSPTTTIWDTDHIFSAGERESFVEAYWSAVDGRFERGSFDRRFPAYVRSNCLLGITWVCNAVVEYHDPQRPLRNERTLKLFDTYLSEGFLETCRSICFSGMGA